MQLSTFYYSINDIFDFMIINKLLYNLLWSHIFKFSVLTVNENLHYNSRFYKSFMFEDLLCWLMMGMLCFPHLHILYQPGHSIRAIKKIIFIKLFALIS